MHEDMEIESSDHPDAQLSPPSESMRMRLSRLFNASMSTAMEELYPRLTNATDWAAQNAPESDLLHKRPSYVMAGIDSKKQGVEDGIVFLPRMSKFILVAAFIASTNPAISDLRMFGRGLDEKKRKRRARKTAGKTKSGPAKVGVPSNPLYFIAAQ